jgi:CheY-like chemotaxis protein
MARALIVEDEQDIRDLLTMTVAEHGYEAEAAANGREALRALCDATAADKLFDVILLDISMPDVNGWRVLAAIQANPLWEDITVIVVTGAAGSAAEITTMAEHGALYVDKGTDYLSYVGAMLNRLAPPE